MRFSLSATVPLFVGTLSLVKADDFRVVYRADFAYLLAGNCRGPFPELVPTCGPGGTIEFLTTTPDDGSLRCSAAEGGSSELAQDYGLPTGRDGLICTTSCAENDDGCEGIFIVSDYEDDIYASIYYSCSGDTLESVETSLLYAGQNGNGSCGISGGFADNRNFHVSRLFVNCPSLAAKRGEASSIGGSYVTDDGIFECRDNGDSKPSHPVLAFPDKLMGHASHGLTCGAGANCDYGECTVSFGDGFLITTKAGKLAQEECIEYLSADAALDSNDVNEAANQDYVAPDVEGLRVTTYKAGYGKFLKLVGEDFFVDYFSSSGVTMLGELELILSCDMGGEIELLDEGFSSISCSQSDASTIVCSNSGQKGSDFDDKAYHGEFQYISYHCKSTTAHPVSSVS